MRIVDNGGHVLNSVTLNSQAPILHDQPYGTPWQELSTTNIPVVAGLVYVDGATAIEVVKNNQIVSHNSIQPLTLKQIVADIPDLGFVLNPYASRLVLSLEAEAIQHAIEVKKYAQAKVALSLFADELQYDLKNNYTASNGELNKAQVLADILSIRNSIGN